MVLLLIGKLVQVSLADVVWIELVGDGRSVGRC